MEKTKLLQTLLAFHHTLNHIQRSILFLFIIIQLFCSLENGANLKNVHV